MKKLAGTEANLLQRHLRLAHKPKKKKKRGANVSRPVTREPQNTFTAHRQQQQHSTFKFQRVNNLGASEKRVGRGTRAKGEGSGVAGGRGCTTPRRSSSVGGHVTSPWRRQFFGVFFMQMRRFINAICWRRMKLSN